MNSCSTENLHPNLVLSHHGAVDVLRVEREEALGAMTFEMMTALGDYVSGLGAEKKPQEDDATGVRVVIFTGTGRGFVAGADIGGYHGVRQVEFDAFQRRSRQTFDAIAALPQVTICAVNGYALGGGFELALCCDFVLLSDKAKLGLPEIKLGLLPGGADAAGKNAMKEQVDIVTLNNEQAKTIDTALKPVVGKRLADIDRSGVDSAQALSLLKAEIAAQ